MQLKALLDVEVVAVEAADEVSLLLELTAPSSTTEEVRAPAALVVVLDRSGSMAGERLLGAKRALVDVVERLDPRDTFGLVAFDDDAEVVFPAGPVRDKAAICGAIAGIRPGGCTHLAAGYLRGLQEVRRAGGGGTARVLLISDGHANAGVTDPVRLGEVASTAAASSVVTSTLGFGLGYDESLLGAIARSGSGAELFAEEADTAVGLIAGEVEGLLAHTVASASLLVHLAPEVAGIRVVNDLPAHHIGGGAMVELGGFLAGEVRRLVLSFSVPGMPALGLAQVATLELR